MKFLKFLILIMAVKTASYSVQKVRVIDNYVCDLLTPSASFILNYFNVSKWSIGFWMKVPMSAGIDAELLTLDYPSMSTRIVYKVKTVDGTNYSLCYDVSNCLLFGGSGPLDDSNFAYLRKIASNNWQYFTISLDNDGTSDVVVTAVPLNSYSVQIGHPFSSSSTTLVVGSDVQAGGSLCRLVSHIHRLDFFENTYNFHYGALLDPKQLISSWGNDFTVLYLMNQSPSDYHLLNLFDPTKKKATVSSDRTTKKALANPKYLNNNMNFAFEKQKITISYPSEVIPESPTDNSYSFVATVTFYTTNIYSSTCSAPYSCPTGFMSFKPYIRAPRTLPSFSNLGM
jgi:hypothetical protein